MADPILFRDAIENLVDFIQGGPQDAEQRLFKRTIREAYREFIEVQPWSYFETECTLLLPERGPLVRLRYDHATKRLMSAFPILSATNTSPVVVGISSAFAAKDGERVSIKNIAGTADDEYEIDFVAGNDWTLLGSTSTGGGEASGTDNATWLGGDNAVWLDGSNATWMGEGGAGGLEGDEVVWRFTFSEEHVGQRVIYNNTSYPIQEWVDSTTVTLPVEANPGASIAGGDFIMQPHSILLPEDFYKMGTIVENQAARWSDSYLDPDAWLRFEQAYLRNWTSAPFRWTIMPSRYMVDRWEIRWVGNLGANRRVSFIYLRRPKDDLRWAGLEPGANSIGQAKIATTAGSRTVTGTNTAFSSTMIGAWIRIGRTKVNNNSYPSGMDGNDPYQELRQIKAVNSATSLTLDKPAKYTGTDLSFLISSRIDIAQEHFNAFYACCQKLLAIKTQDEDRIQVAVGRYRESLRLAMEGDYKLRFNREASNSFHIPTPYGSPRNANIGPYVPTPFG